MAVDPEPSLSGAGGWALRPASVVMSRDQPGPRDGLGAFARSDAAIASSSPGGRSAGGTLDNAAPSHAERSPGESGSAAAMDQQPWHLFAFPLESNFSGVRYDEALRTAAEELEGPACGAHGQETGARQGPAGPCWRRGRWAVLLDAAKGCGTCPPDLSKNPVDFVVRFPCAHTRCSLKASAGVSCSKQELLTAALIGCVGCLMRLGKTPHTPAG